MSILKMFYNPNSDKNPKISQQPERNNNGNGVVPQVNPQMYSPQYGGIFPTQTTVGMIDQKIFEVLSQALEDNALAENDYWKFKKSLDNMRQIAMDEQTKFKAVFASFQANGVDVSHLLDTAKHYINVLESQRDSFTRDLQTQFGDELQQHENTVEELKTQIAEKTEKIKQLTQEIQDNQTQSMSLSGEINIGKLKIQGLQANFDITYSVVEGEIQSNIQKISTYLEQSTIVQPQISRKK